MSSSESDSQVVTEDEDEGKLYQVIYDMNTANDKEEKEIPSSSGHTPVRLKLHAERRTRVLADNTFNIQGIPVLKMDEDEKPWKKAGAVISDYFNYGFDEESWTAFCKKQRELRTANRKLSAEIMVQKGHSRHEEKVPCFASSGKPSIPASRQSSSTTDVIGGQLRSRGRMEGRQSPTDEGNSTQVVTEMSPKEDRITSYHLTPPSNFSSLFTYTTPPRFLYRREPSPLCPLSTLDSEHLKGPDDPSTSLYPCSAGVSTLIPRNVASSAGVIDTAKDWERIRQQKCDNDRDRSREHGHDKNRKRGRDRDRDSCFSSHNSGHLKGLDDPSASPYPCSSGMSALIPRNVAGSAGVIDTAKDWERIIWQEKCDDDRYRSRERGHDKDSKRGRDRDSCYSSHNSGEERTRHRDTTERGHKHHRRHTGEKDEGQQETRHRNKNQGWQKSSCSGGSSSSSRGRRDDGEDSQSRHKRAKRNRKDKETN